MYEIFTCWRYSGVRTVRLLGVSSSCTLGLNGHSGSGSPRNGSLFVFVMMFGGFGRKQVRMDVYLLYRLSSCVLISFSMCRMRL